MGKILINKTWILMILILILSASLNTINCGVNINYYYAASIKSMLINWKNLFFVSYDPAGFVSVDKPPLGLWIQALFAKIFGLNNFILVLPQIIAGVLSVFLIFILIKKSFGDEAGLLSAFMLAITPIFVAVSRNNTMDMQLIFILLCSTWMLFKAIEKNSLPFLILTAFLIGLGFNIKMMQAFIILPAVFIVIVLGMKISTSKKILNILIALLVLIIVSFSWTVIVDSIPASQRPYIGGSIQNSVTELTIGYNGIFRIVMLFSPDVKSAASIAENPLIIETGKAGLLRIFNPQLSGQISWFIPLALAGLIAFLLKERFLLKADNSKKVSILYWSAWFFVIFLYSSFTTGIFHRYYLAMLAPPIAALTGIGIFLMVKNFNEHKWIGLLLPISAMVSIIISILISIYNYPWNRWLIPIILFTGIISTGMMLWMKNGGNRYLKKRFIFACILAFISIILSPLTWSISPMIYGDNGGLPIAGPDANKRNSKNNQTFQPKEITNFNETILSLVKYLNSKKNNEKYIVAVSMAVPVSTAIIYNTGSSVMTYGGFTGMDKILNKEQFIRKVINSELRYAIMVSDEISGFNIKLNKEIDNWIIDKGKRIERKEWDEKYDDNISNKKDENSIQLFDCKTEAFMNEKPMNAEVDKKSKIITTGSQLDYFANINSIVD